MAMGYKASLDWLLDNDDCEWLADCEPSPSITLLLVADIFGKDSDKAIADLAKRQAKRDELS